MGEYEGDDPQPGQKEDHTFTTTTEPTEPELAPRPKGAAERVKNELNQIERHLDLTQTALQPYKEDDDFAETFKEQQARKILETQFTKPPTTSNMANQERKLEAAINSSPLTKIAQLKEDNRQRRIQHQLDVVETNLTSRWHLPTPPDTPPPKMSQRFQQLGQAIEISRTTAATEWAIEAQKTTTKEAPELPRHYSQHWRAFSEKLAQRFPPERKDDHAIKLRPGAPDTIPGRAYKWMPEEDKVGREWLTENEDLGYIEKGDLPWATPCFFVKKKDGKLRLVQDYRVVNEWTIPDVYPLPQIETILEQLEGKALFTTLDI
jgi:heme oxygenase